VTIDSPACLGCSRTVTVPVTAGTELLANVLLEWGGEEQPGVYLEHVVEAIKFT
jgi:hypothetical protein